MSDHLVELFLLQAEITLVQGLHAEMNLISWFKFRYQVKCFLNVEIFLLAHVHFLYKLFFSIFWQFLPELKTVAKHPLSILQS